jgi:bacillolysin
MRVPTVSTSIFLQALLLLQCTTFNAHAKSASFARSLSSQYETQSTSFIFGRSLGVVDANTLGLVEFNPGAVKEAAAAEALDILTELKGFTGEEVILPTQSKIGVDDKGNLHVRLVQFWNGLPMEGASMMVHFSAQEGNIFALNGEFHSAYSIDLDTPQEDELDCEVAVEIALNEYGLAANGAWESKCERSAVQGRNGQPYVAFKRMRGYQSEGGLYQRDLLFASLTTGELLAVHPKVYSALAVNTLDCRNGNGSLCYLVSNSSNYINSSDVAANAAHNHAIDTYNFYKDFFNRDSFDEEGMTIRSFVHYKAKYNNAAYFGNGQIVYGDGDGEHYSHPAPMISMIQSTLSFIS